MDDDATLLSRIDKFLTGAALDSPEQLDMRQRIDAASVDDLAAAVADVATNTGDIAAVVADVATNTADIATNTGDIAAVVADVATNTADIATNTSDIGDIVATVNAQVVGVASVAGEVGVITGSALLAAINVEDGADVTDAVNVASSIAGVVEKVTPADDDKVPGLDSAAAGVLKWFKISSIVTKAKTLFDTLYASTAQGALADTALQPSTAATLSRLKLTPVALGSLPAASTAGDGTDANINDGSVAAMGSIAVGGGAISQTVRSNGTDWIVASGSSITNPMTTAEDIIVGGVSGSPVRLAKGTEGYVVKIVGGIVAWAAETVGMTNPMTTSGDVVVGGASGAPTRLAKGTDGQTMTMVAGSVAWGAGDHGNLSGNADDDHPQYLRVDGARAGTGIQEMLGINFTDATTLTIASGVITPTATLHVVAAESGVTDELVTMTAAAGNMVFLIADAGDTITVKHGDGNFVSFNATDIIMTATSPVLAFRIGSSWLCVANQSPDNLSTTGQAISMAMIFG
jgi:hypothetical protein